MLGGSFLVLMYATHGITETQRITFLWLVLCTFIYTLGELYLSPIGLSLVTKVAPARLVSMLMGMWFLSSFFGNYLSGYLGTFYEKMPKQNFFMILMTLGLAAGVAMFLFSRPVSKVIAEHERKEAAA
jgi:POT family proton-dependent oligopeptide transporter